MVDRLPRLTELIGRDSLETIAERTPLAALGQLEQDLDLVRQRVGWQAVSDAYRRMLRNREIVAAAYELRAAALIAPAAERIRLRPIGPTGCDFAFQVAGREVFVEVFTSKDTWLSRADEWEPPEEPPFRARETVERSFRLTTPHTSEELETREVTRPQELRERITAKLAQLPGDQLTVVVLGTPNGGRCLHVQEALEGDELGLRSRTTLPTRAGNGLFAVPDEEGGISDLSALVWLRLGPRAYDVKVHGRLFINPRAERPLPVDVAELLRVAFDRTAVLERELDRIVPILVERYGVERVIVFGSMAAHERADNVHRWSDLDLAVVKRTARPFFERVREALDLIAPSIGLNLLVYTPEEFERGLREETFIRDEIGRKGRVLFAKDG